MAQSSPTLPSPEDLGQQIRELADLGKLSGSRGPFLTVHIITAQWNWQIGSRTLRRALGTLIRIQRACGLSSDNSTKLHYIADRLCYADTGFPPAERDGQLDGLDDQEKLAVEGLDSLFKNQFPTREQLERFQENARLRWQVHQVPGSLELPLAAQWALMPRKTRAGEEFSDGVLALGTVIRGETEHFDLVCREASAGLSKVALKYSCPVISGLLALESAEQAKSRIERADDWARSLVHMCLLKHSLL